MSSVNKVILIGNVGADPEVRYLDRGVAIATFNLATTERGYTMQNGTQVPDVTEWHSVVLWRNLAEVVEKYVHKGSQLYIEGRISNRQYKDKDGNDRYATEIVANDMKLLGKRDDGNRQPEGPQLGTVPPPSTEEMPADDLPF